MCTFLVTGAAGGLGSAVCRALARGGARVYAADAGDRAFRQFEGEPDIVPLCMDVTEAGDAARARAGIERDAGGLDGLVCAAGLFRAGPLVESPHDYLALSLDVNLLGAVRVAREFFPLLRARRGTMVVIGSESTRCPMPFTGAYTISKAALEAMAQVLRRELMFVGVHVSIVQPGAIRTPLLQGVQAEMEKAAAGSVFAGELARVQRILPREWDRGMDPGRAAAVVVRALRARRPRARYRVGNDPLRALLGVLPARVADAFIRCFM